MTFQKSRLDRALVRAAPLVRAELLSPDLAERLEHCYVGSFRRDVALDALDVLARGSPKSFGAGKQLFRASAVSH